MPSLAFQTVLTKSGLHIPVTARLGPDPIDLMKPYVTAQEGFGFRIGLPHVLRWLGEADRESVLRASAGILGERQVVGADWNRLDRGLAERLFSEPARTRVLNVMGRDRPLVSPQGLLILAKAALQVSPEDGNPDMAMFVPAVMGLQEDLGSREEAEPEDGTERLTPAGRLFREILRSQSFHSRTYEGTLMPQFQLRWRELSKDMAGDGGAFDLEAAFAEATGVPLDDFSALGIALWSRATQLPGVPVPLTFFSNFHWPDERLERAIQVISRDAATLDAAVTEHEERFGFQWSFDPLRRFPVVRLRDNQLLVLSPRLLFERVSGWLPIYDVKEAFEIADGNPKRARQVDTFFRRVCEREAIDSLRAICGNGLAKRMYDERDLKAAFGRGRTADAALDYGSTWIVAEISTRQLMRESVIGGSREHLETDLDRGIYQKAEQLAATIAALAKDESRLTGVAAVSGRRFIPLLVATEGFPTNPMTTLAIEAELAASGLLTDPRIAPIRIVDQEELYVIEAVVEDGIGGLLDLLEGYDRGRLRGMGFKDWLSAERHLALGRPARIEDAFHRSWRPALDALGDTGKDDETADNS